MERDNQWLLLEQSSQNIAIRTSIERGRVLRALTIFRRALTRDVPEIFYGTIEVYETYLGGQWKNKRKIIRDAGTKRGRGTKNNLFLASYVAMTSAVPKW